MKALTTWEARQLLILVKMAPRTEPQSRQWLALELKLTEMADPAPHMRPAIMLPERFEH